MDAASRASPGSLTSASLPPALHPVAFPSDAADAARRANFEARGRVASHNVVSVRRDRAPILPTPVCPGARCP